jgi:hypothetical protein
MTPAPALDELIATIEDRAGAGDPLARLSAATTLAAELGVTADALVNHFVVACREAGASWSQIGAALGVSKQGAQQRFVGRAATTADVGPMERFTGRAKAAVAAAEAEARRLGHGYVGTEHLLLGLLRDPDSLAVKAIEGCGTAVEAVRSAAEAGLSPGEGSDTADIPLTPRARRALDLTLGTALRLGHNYIGTEHLLLGLAEEGEGVAGRVLQGFGLTPPALRAKIVELLSGYKPNLG